MTYFLQQLANGLATGSIYALVAIGYSVIYGALQMVNFAHGDLYMIGTFVFMTVSLATGQLWIAIICGMICSATLAMGVERFAYRPIRGTNFVTPMISAFGAALVIRNICQLIWSTRTYPFPVKVPTGTFKIGTVQLSVVQIIIFTVALLIMIGISFLLKKTRIGQAVSCVSQNITSAQLMGINTNRTIATLYGCGALLGVIGGIFFALYFNTIYIGMGFLGTMKGWIAAVVGGIGNIKGTFIAGLLLGIFEIFASGFISSGYKDVISYALVIIILLWKPNGLFGAQIAEKA